MKLQLLLCLAGGALIAGLTGQEPSSHDPAPQGSTPGLSAADDCCSSAALARTSCTVDAEALGLTPEQSKVLERLCLTECAEVDTIELRARAALEAFYARLADAEARAEELHGLANEASELRAQALTALVDAIVEVRAVLEPGQLEQLVGGCCRKNE